MDTEIGLFLLLVACTLVGLMSSPGNAAVAARSAVPRVAEAGIVDLAALPLRRAGGDRMTTGRPDGAARGGAPLACRPPSLRTNRLRP